MAEKHIITKTRLDLADFLKANSADISHAAREIVKAWVYREICLEMCTRS